ncbi:MAG: hypothetical protein LBP32_02305, partial [Spirochaetaceae bacterium]|nr:hypothetical protein [Spirochaetaceae bacterium]
MAYTAAFDLGTTAVKGVLISDDRKPVFQDSLPIETYFPGDRAEQNPHDWYRAFLGVSRGIFRGGFKPEEIRGIIMSGQMQDFIPVDKQGEPVGNAVLYSDGRAGEEAAYLNSLLGEERIRRITGNAMDGSIPAAKLLWYRRHEAENYKKTALVLGSPKDYIILKLCGRAVGDITAASTFGLMDIRTKRWDTAFLEALAVPPGLLPELLSCGERAGTVSAAGADQSGFAP